MSTRQNEKLVKELGFAANEEALGKRFWIGMGGGGSHFDRIDYG